MDRHIQHKSLTLIDLKETVLQLLIPNGILHVGKGSETYETELQYQQ